MCTQMMRITIYLTILDNSNSYLRGNIAYNGVLHLVVFANGYHVMLFCSPDVVEVLYR